MRLLSPTQLYPLDLKEIKELIALMRKNDLAVFKMETADFKITLKKGTDFETFFQEAPRPNPARSLIKGLICGIRVEEIQAPTMRKSAIWANWVMHCQRENRWTRFCGACPSAVLGYDRSSNGG